MTIDKRIAVSECYGPVLQGEGPSAGQATVFLRTFACDSLCAVCDSLYAVDPKRPDAKYELLSSEEVVDRIERIDNDLPVTFSGGNPVLWDLDSVITLLGVNRAIWVETQGTYWRDWLERCQQVVVSPKGPFMNDRKLGLTSFAALDAFHTRLSKDCLFFKVVVGGPADLDYAEAIARRYWRPIYLSLGCPREEGVIKVGAWQMSPADVSPFLLARYRNLIALLLDPAHSLRWKELRARAHFTPQLHVLAFGDARSV